MLSRSKLFFFCTDQNCNPQSNFRLYSNVRWLRPKSVPFTNAHCIFSWATFTFLPCVLVFIIMRGDDETDNVNDDVACGRGLSATKKRKSLILFNAQSDNNDVLLHNLLLSFQLTSNTFFVGTDFTSETRCFSIVIFKCLRRFHVFFSRPRRTKEFHSIQISTQYTHAIAEAHEISAENQQVDFLCFFSSSSHFHFSQMLFLPILWEIYLLVYLQWIIDARSSRLRSPTCYMKLNGIDRSRKAAEESDKKLFLCKTQIIAFRRRKRFRNILLRLMFVLNNRKNRQQLQTNFLSFSSAPLRGKLWCKFFMICLRFFLSVLLSIG